MKTFRVHTRVLFFLLWISGADGIAQNSITDSLKIAYQKENNDSIKVKILLNLANQETKSGPAIKGMRYLAEAFRLSRNSNYYTGMRLCLGKLSDMFYISEHFEQGIKIGLLAEKFFILKKDTNALKQTYLRLGVNYSSISLLNEGTKEYYKALDLCERTHDTAGLSYVYNNLGLSYSEQRNYEKTMEYLLKSLEYKKRAGDSLSLVRAYGNLINVNLEMGVFKDLLHYGYISRSYFPRNDTNEICSTVYLNIASAYAGLIRLPNDSVKLFLPYSIEESKLKQTCLDSCLFYNSRAKAYCDLYQDDYTFAYICNSSAQAYFYSHNSKKATELFEKAKAIFKKYSAKKELMNTFAMMASAYKELGDYKKSYESLEHFVLLKDTLFTESKQKEFAQFETKFQYERKLSDEKEEKEKQIELANTQKLTQRVIIISITVILLIIIIFSISLYKRFRLSQHQKLIIEEKNKEITDSIHYAERIQKALLTGDELLKNSFKGSFIFYQPKDIVSGDFYWANKANDKLYVVIGDCTGHGVPGAFMSLINISFLNEALNEKQLRRPDEILNHVRKSIINALKADGSEEGGKDGMDCALLCFDTRSGMLDYCCANNSFVILRNDEIIEAESNRMPVGRSPKEKEPFIMKSIQLISGDTLYAFTDGFADQFGGQKGKKYKYKNLLEKIKAFNHLKMNDQSVELKKEFNAWKGSIEQIDDVLLIGIKI